MKKNIVITVLAILVLSLGGYLVYDKVLSSDNNEVKEESENKDDKLITSTYTTKCNGDLEQSFTVYGDVSKYSNVFDYIEDQKDLSMKLTYCTKEVESEGEAGVFYKKADYNLSSTEISEFITEMKKDTAKYLSGGHSSQCSGNLEISYKINEVQNNVKISMTGVQILSSTDGNIYKIIDSNVTGEKPASCYYSAGTQSQTIVNIINKLR